MTRWLDGRGLGQYAAVFADNDIEFEVLPRLTDQDLKDLGVSLGHRRKLLAEITAGGVTDAGSGEANTLVSARPASEAERRHLTVMFCDLVGSTAISEALDPEDMGDLIRSYQDAVGAEIASYEGYVAKLMGDGVLAYFGWPQAHEDDAERAVRSALAIVEAVGRQSLLGGEPPRVRIGIATGLVVVGDLIGEVVGEEGAVVGGTPNLAARLQGVAEPNAIVIGESTRALLGENFAYEDLGYEELKGIAAPVKVWRVVRSVEIKSRFEATRATRLTPLVGREEDLDLLKRRWDQAVEGEGQVVLLSGEPGIGKSRLAHAFHKQIARQPHIRLLYQCSPYYSNSALYPLIRQTEHLAGFAREDTNEQKLDKLEALLGAATKHIKQVAPLIAALLSIPTGDRYPPLNLSSQVQKDRTLAALLEQLEGLSTQLPVLLIFEDAHWIDPTSQKLLDLVVERAQAIRLTALITFRPEYRAPWTEQPHVSHLMLNRLARKLRTAMANELSGGKELPAEVLEQIVVKTDGVPLFVEELTKTVLASGLLKEEKDRFVLDGPLPPLAIPTTLQDSLVARLDKLAPVKEVAQIGAVIGREFSHQLLAAVSELPEGALNEALALLTKSELVFARGAPPEASYTFKHALVQDAAYQSLLKSRRPRIHARIAQVLEQQFPDRVEIEPELLAHHYSQARLTEQAVTCWQRAGERAVARSAHLEAIGHLNQGLALLQDLDSGSKRDGHELNLQSALGPPLTATKGYASDEARKAFTRARELWHKVGGDTAQLCPILWGLWVNYLVRAEHQAAGDLSEELLSAAKSIEDTQFILDAHVAITCSTFYMGEFDLAREHGDCVVELYDPQLLGQHSLENPRIAGGMLSALALWMLGYPDQALAMNSETLSIAREGWHLFGRAAGLTWAAMVHHCRREAGEAQALAEEALVITREQGFPYWESRAAVERGWALTEQGHGQEGMVQVREAAALMQATGSGIWRPYQLSLLAEANAKAGRAQEALTLLSEALTSARKTKERYWEPELHRMKGELYLAGTTEDLGKAERCFKQALKVARKQQAKSLELRAAINLARLWQGQGKQVQARQKLAPIYHWFTEGFDTADLKEAKALLDELS